MIFKVLEFEDYKDFYSKCNKLKEIYDVFYIAFKYTEEVFKYRDYIYNKDMQEFEKNAIWDYLNDYLPKEELRSKVKANKKVEEVFEPCSLEEIFETEKVEEVFKSKEVLSAEEVLHILNL